jgi:hypothetical protein
MQRHQLQPDVNRPDRVREHLSPGTVVTITEDARYDHLPGLLLEPLKGRPRRDWFVDHVYHCLPVVMASQLGFLVKAHYDFTVLWDGTVGRAGLIVQHAAGPDTFAEQLVTSHFGMGVVTIQNRWTFRTPAGVNLLVKSPPNYWIDGIHFMEGLVETDQLRRDFTFNLKVTRPGASITIKRGTPIGCVLPVPRHFVDPFTWRNAPQALPADVIADERETMRLAGEERTRFDVKNPHGVGGRYRRGEDVYGNKFPDHQTRLG